MKEFTGKLDAVDGLKPFDGDVVGVDGKPVAKRSAIGEIGNQIAGGFRVEIPKMVGDALKYTSDPGNSVYDVGQKITDFGKRAEADYRPDEFGHGDVVNALASGGRMLGPSVAPAVAAGGLIVGGAAATGAAVPAAIGLGGAALLGAIPAALSQGQDTLEKARAKGVNEADALAAARTNAFIEGAGETAGTYFGGKLLGLGGKVVSKTLGKTADPLGAAANEFVNPSVLKPFLKQLPQTAAVEVGTEVGQQSAQAAVENAYGVDDRSPFEAGKSAIAPTLGLTALLAPFGLAGFAAKAGRQRKIGETLTNTEATPEERFAALDTIHGEISKVDKEGADTFRAEAEAAIAANKAIVLPGQQAQEQAAPDEPTEPTLALPSSVTIRAGENTPQSPEDIAATNAADDNAARVYADRQTEEIRRAEVDPSYDQLIAGQVNLQNFSRNGKPQDIDQAQARAEISTSAGVPLTVIPHVDGGYTVMPTAYLSGDQQTRLQTLQAGAPRPQSVPALPSPQSIPARPEMSVNSAGVAQPLTFDQQAAVQAQRAEADSISGRPTFKPWEQANAGALSRAIGAGVKTGAINEAAALGQQPTTNQLPILSGPTTTATQEKALAPLLDQSQEIKPVRQAFRDINEVSTSDFVKDAIAEGIDPQMAERLAAKRGAASTDSVTGFFNGQTNGTKSATVGRAIKHVAETNEPAFYIDADIANLGGLNNFVANDAEKANVHYRALANIMREELQKTGADVVPMRTGGDEIGAVVVNATEDSIKQAQEAIKMRIAEYTKSNNLHNIPHPKGKQAGVGLHLGYSEILPGRSLGEIFTEASKNLDRSKNEPREQRRPTRVDGVDARAAGIQAEGNGRILRENERRGESQTSGDVGREASQNEDGQVDAGALAERVREQPEVREVQSAPEKESNSSRSADRPKPVGPGKNINLVGKTVKQKINIDGTEAELEFNAETAIPELEARIKNVEKLVACL